MSDSATSSPGTGLSSPGTGLSVLAPLARASDAIVRSFDRVAYVGWAAAAGVVGPVLTWVWPVGVPAGIGFALLFVVLLVPGLFIFLLARAVAGLAGLPTSVINQVVSAQEGPALEFSGGGLRRVWCVGRYLLGIRGVLWALKDQLTSAGAVLRLASVPILIGSLAAVLAIALMVPLAVVLVIAAAATL
ncbi:MAG: hypothetical protein HKN29_11895 [Rhodothermales bacterium]|nr:hypothetical protein [Rhodothermales bacterium]